MVALLAVKDHKCPSCGAPFNKNEARKWYAIKNYGSYPFERFYAVDALMCPNCPHELKYGKTLGYIQAERHRDLCVRMVNGSYPSMDELISEWLS